MNNWNKILPKELTDNDLLFYKKYQQEIYNTALDEFKLFDVVKMNILCSHDKFSGYGIIAQLTNMTDYYYVIRYSELSDRFWMCGYSSHELEFVNKTMHEIPKVMNAMKDWLLENTFKCSGGYFKKSYSNFIGDDKCKERIDIYKQHGKEGLLNYIKSLPDDLQWFKDEMDYNAIDIRVFKEQKDNKFLRWYFGM